jgi:hypothetical protein
MEEAMLETPIKSRVDRRHLVGGSDARVIMGQDEKALIRLWQEKRGEVEPEDLSTNLIVRLGVVTEDLNRACHEYRERTRLRILTPGPPPFSSMNSMPAASSASCNLSIVDCLASDPFSMRVTVLAVMPAFSASSLTPQPTAARAIRS